MPEALCGFWQLAVLWGGVLRAGEAVEVVKLGIDKEIKRADILRLALKDSGLTSPQHQHASSVSFPFQYATPAAASASTHPMDWPG